MRCPACQFVSSDSRDICPKCFCDLRPAKSKAGLEVTDPTSSYDTLLARAGAPADVQAKASKEKPSGGLSGFFKKKPDAPEVQAHDRDAPKPQYEPTVDSTPPPQQPQPNQGAHVVTPPSQVAPAAPSKLEQARKAQIEAALKAQQPQAEAPTPKRVLKVTEPAKLTRSIFRTYAPPTDVAATQSDFDDASVEIQTLGIEDSVELTAASLADVLTDDSVTALFNLAYDVFEKPELEDRLVQNVATSAERKVEAKELAKALAKVEKKMQLPVFGLRSLGAKMAAARDAAANEPARERPTASAGERFACFLIDLAGMMVMSIAIGLGAFSFADSDFLIRFKDPASLNSPDLFGFGCVALAAFLILIWAYAPLCYGLFRRTPGQRWCRLRVFTESGRKARASHLWVRSLTFPISALCFGYLPVLRGKQPWHDTLARTRLCRDEG